MNIIFLDMDGVVNGDKYKERTVPILIDRINEIVNKTDCSIVWSSSWRIGYSLLESKILFSEVNLPHEKLIGMTPNINCVYSPHKNDYEWVHYVPRWKEIDLWLKTAGFKGKSVIIDDDTDAFHMEMLDDHKIMFCNTYFEDGITEKDKDNCIKYLMEN